MQRPRAKAHGLRHDRVGPLSFPVSTPARQHRRRGPRRIFTWIAGTSLRPSIAPRSSIFPTARRGTRVVSANARSGTLAWLRQVRAGTRFVTHEWELAGGAAFDRRRPSGWTWRPVAVPVRPGEASRRCRAGRDPAGSPPSVHGAAAVSVFRSHRERAGRAKATANPVDAPSSAHIGRCRRWVVDGRSRTSSIPLTAILNTRCRHQHLRKSGRAKLRHRDSISCGRQRAAGVIRRLRTMFKKGELEPSPSPQRRLLKDRPGSTTRSCDPSVHLAVAPSCRRCA